MSRIEALAELIAKVEAGHWMHGANTATRAIFPYDEMSENDLGLCAFAAFEGSLDAAKALHEAVLPGAWAHVRYTGEYGHATVDVKGEEYDANNADNPARAWLLAILRALHAQEAAE